MISEIVDLLKSYLMAWKNIFDVAEYIASIDWDGPALEKALVEVIGQLEVLSTEVIEGLRPETDFREKAIEIVSRLSDSAYFLPVSDLNLISGASSASSTTQAGVRVVGTTAARPSWSISPPLVSVS